MDEYFYSNIRSIRFTPSCDHLMHAVTGIACTKNMGIRTKGMAFVFFHFLQLKLPFPIPFNAPFASPEGPFVEVHFLLTFTVLKMAFSADLVLTLATPVPNYLLVTIADTQSSGPGFEARGRSTYTLQAEEVEALHCVHLSRNRAKRVVKQGTGWFRKESNL